MKPLISILLILLVFSTACQNVAVTPGNISSSSTATSTVQVIPSTPQNATITAHATSLTPGNELPQVSPTLDIATPDVPISTDMPALDLHTQYTLTATLDYGWRFLAVQQEVLIPNVSTDTLSELILIVQPNWHPDAFILNSFTWEDGTPVTTYELDGIKLRVFLLAPFKPGETIRLFLEYEINIPPLLTSEDFGPNPFGYTTRQTNLTDWYPFVPPYIDGVGWLAHNPWYYGEHLVYPAADFDVTIQLTNAPAGTVIAASALDMGNGVLHRYRLERARNFVWSVSPEYRVFQEQIGGTTVLGYAFPYEQVAGEAAFKTTVNALETFNQIFGPYPFNGLTVVQADFEHGMEYSGLYFLSKAFYSTYDGTPSTYLVAIAAHETAHQWWYGLVGNDQALEPWLDEALCTYSEKLFYENLYPKSLGWWEYARVNYYEPTGWVDSTIYNTPGYRPYRDAVYLNGALFMDELRSLIGDQVFHAFLLDYVARSTGKIATADDFFSILREYTEADWSALLVKYFENR